jgi:hypothetical protein
MGLETAGNFVFICYVSWGMFKGPLDDIIVRVESLKDMYKEEYDDLQLQWGAEGYGLEAVLLGVKKVA